ncbi:MAG TPA: hypothetical protein VJT31_01810 [Rugosimonospora sp.]|nr:hypothetical protein [Rugosimonospora sp.]
MNLVSILLVVGAVGYVMWQRLTGVPLQAKRLVVLPAILLILGGYQLRGHHITTMDAVLLAAELAVAVGLGLVRGTTIRLYEQAGHLWYRYRPLTIVVWLVSAVARVGMGLGGHVLGSTLATGATLMLMVGATFIGEAAVVGARAMRTGVPFAPDRRSVRGAAGVRRMP